MSCRICYENIDDLDHISYNLIPLEYCIDCYYYIINNTFNEYVKKLKTIDCEKSLKNMISCGIPIYFRDTQINNNIEIQSFIYHDKGLSGKLNCPLSIEQVNELNKKLKIAIDDIDYLSNIKSILSSY